MVSTSTFQDTSGNSGCAATAAAYFRTSSTVSWSENGGASSPSVTEDSLLSRPVSGDLHTQVVDQTGQGLSGASITATPNPVTPPISTTQTATTDSTGCVLFAGLAAGAYTVTATDPGYMDMNGNQSPLSSVASVTSSGLTSPTTNPFVMGLPGSIVGTFAGPTSTTATAEADAMSWSGSGPSGNASGVIPVTAPHDPRPRLAGLHRKPAVPVRHGSVAGHAQLQRQLHGVGRALRAAKAAGGERDAGQRGPGSQLFGAGDPGAAPVPR